MKKITMFLGFAFIAVLLMSGCDYKPNTNEVLAGKQEQLMKEANSQVGMPAITRFTERKMMKLILELRDQADLICYAYIIPEMTGKPVFLGKCIGYGLPYATQYTNPEVKDVGQYGNVTLPQADPNGLFMPASADGTWLLMIDPASKEPKPVYIEPKILVSPFPLNQQDK